MLDRDENSSEFYRIYEMAPTLAEMYQYAEQERNLKKASAE